ncbi:M23 family metallopeptidase [Niabella soli]|nr:M23 family metallopeptidase [Niabella soli]
MSTKTGVAGISGNHHPRIGDKTSFDITGWYPDTPAHLRHEKNITWELFKRRDDGHYTTTGIKKKGESFFIFGQTALGHQYRVEGYLTQPEGRAPMAMDVVPVDTNTPHFTGIEIYDAAGNRVKGPLQYGMKVKIVVLSVGMPGKNIKISLWEDTGPNWPKLPHYAEGVKATINKNGVAKAEFVLKPDFKKLTAAADQLHAYYITVEYWSSPDKKAFLASDHINLINPDFRKYDLFERPKPVKTALPLKTQQQVKDHLPTPALKATDWTESPLFIAGSAFRQWTVAKGSQKYMVGGKETASKNTKCLCEEYDLIWGDKVSCGFRKKVVEISKEIWPNDYRNMANNLMACMALETGGTFNPHDSNKNGYFGLIGFGDGSVMDIGTTRENIMTIDGISQLNWVKKRLQYVQKYLMNNGKGGVLRDFTDLYLAVIYPTKSGLLQNEDAKTKIIFDASIDKKHMLEYRQNPTFMKEQGEYNNKQEVTFKRRGKDGELKDVTEVLRGYAEETKGKTYRWEITATVESWHENGKNNKINVFSCKEQEQDSKSSQCPTDCSQCFDYADVWNNPEISDDNGGKNNNRFGFNSSRGHKGIDILSGPMYKTVHSLMCGEVVSVVDTFKTNEYKEHSLGNTLMIKSKDKNGKEVFILYCHLDKIYVKKAQKVKHGQAIALSGSTGNASYAGLANGKPEHGINNKYWHCHIEAATKGEGYNNFYSLGSFRIKAEDYMKTKFDKNGNAIK